MRVSSLQPHFAIETPADSEGDSKRVISAAQNRDRWDARESTASDTTQGGIDERTRETLRRLSHLIRDKAARRDSHDNERGRESSEEQSPPEGDSDIDDEVRFGGGSSDVKTGSVYMSRTERALGTYRYALRAGARDETVGSLLKLAV